MQNNIKHPQSKDCIDLAIAELCNSLHSLDKQTLLEFAALQYLKMLQNSEGCSLEGAVWELLGEFLACKNDETLAA